MTASVRPARPSPTQPTSFEFKSEPFSLVVLWLKSANWAEVQADLDGKLGRTPGFFDNDPVVADLTLVEQADSIDFDALKDTLKRHGAVTVAVRNGTQAQQAAALAAGLGLIASGAGEAPAKTVNDAASVAPVEPEPAATTPTMAAQTETVTPAGSRIVDKPVRTGQQSYARHGDLIVRDMVSAGGEVLADGNISVYGPLRGRALAGVRGDTTARIFTLSLEAELVSIAGIYRTFEHDWGKEFRGKPAQIYLDGDKLMIASL